MSKEAAVRPLPRLAPEVGGPWSRWPDPTRGGTIELERVKNRPAPNAKRSVPPSAGDPVSIVITLTRYVAEMRRAQRPDECITVTMRQVLDALGFAHPVALASDSRRPVEKLCWATLLVLGFKPGTRGKDPLKRSQNMVLRLQADPQMPPACASLSSANPGGVMPPSNEPARLNHTGPTGTAVTQRWLAAEKRSRPGCLKT